MIERHECDERALKIARQHEPDDGHMCAQLQCKIIDAMQWASAASPAPSLPEDAERVVERLRAPGTWARHSDSLVASSAAETLIRDDAPFEAASLIQSLSSQLAEARAKRDYHLRSAGNHFAQSCEYADRALTAEADRDRLAAENERLREALTPSGETKAAYIGEFYERIEIANPEFDDDDLAPETIMHPFMVSWTTIKEIMAAISARAALDPGETLPVQALAGVPTSEICPACDGSGEYADWGGVCPTCGGTGGLRAALAGKAGEA